MSSVPPWLESLKSSDRDAYESITRYLFRDDNNSPQRGSSSISVPATASPHPHPPPPSLSKSGYGNQGWSGHYKRPLLPPIAQLSAPPHQSHYPMNQQNEPSPKMMPQGSVSSVQNIRVEYQTTTYGHTLSQSPPGPPPGMHHPQQLNPTSNARDSPMLPKPAPAPAPPPSSYHSQPAFPQPQSRPQFQERSVSLPPSKTYGYPPAVQTANHDPLPPVSPNWNHQNIQTIHQHSVPVDPQLTMMQSKISPSLTQHPQTSSRNGNGRSKAAKAKPLAKEITAPQVPVISSPAMEQQLTRTVPALPKPEEEFSQNYMQKQENSGDPIPPARRGAFREHLANTRPFSIAGHGLPLNTWAQTSDSVQQAPNVANKPTPPPTPTLIPDPQINQPVPVPNPPKASARASPQKNLSEPSLQTMLLPNNPPPQGQPVFRGELYKNLVQRETVAIPHRTKSPAQSHHPSPQPNPVVAATPVTCPSASNLTVSTFGNAPLTQPLPSPEETLPNLFTNPPPPTTTKITTFVAAAPVPPPQLPTPPATPAPWTALRVSSLIAILLAITDQSLTNIEEQIIREIFQKVGITADPETVFLALLDERIIQQSQLNRLRSSFSAIDTCTTLLESLHSPSEEEKKRGRPTKKQLKERAMALIDKDPKTTEGWFLKIFQEYALEKKTPGYVAKIAAIRKDVKSEGAKFAEEMEALLKEKEMFTLEDGVNVRKKVNEELERLKKEDAKNQLASGNPSAQSQNAASNQSSQQQSAGSASMQASNTSNPGYGPNRTGSAGGIPQQATAKRSRKSQEPQTIAQYLPYQNLQINLIPSIKSWPKDQIARNILLAAGRIVPGEEDMPRINVAFEPIVKTITPLRSAELTTIEWEKVDPRPVDLATSVRQKLQMAPIPPPPQPKKHTVNTPSNIEFTPPLAMGPSSLSNPSKKSVTNTTPTTPTARTSGATSAPFQFPKFTELDKIPDTAPYFGKALSVSSVESDDAILKMISPQQHPMASASATVPSPYPPRPPYTTTPKPSPTLALGKSILKRTTSTPASKPAKPTAPKKSTPKSKSVGKTTPISTPLRTPGKRLTPQVVIATTPKIRLTPGMAYMDEDATPKRGQSRKRVSRLSVTPSKPPKPASTSRSRGTVIDLTSEKSKPIIITSSSSASPVEVDKSYKSYPCHWTNCQAELHSFETLEQHVLKIHSKPDPKSNMIKCLWKGCPGPSGAREYHDREEWEFHVRRIHLALVQLACGVKGCSDMFPTNEALQNHYTKDHAGSDSPKRKAEESPTSSSKRRRT